MPQKTAFYQSRHYLLKQKWTEEKEIQYYLETIYNQQPLIVYIMDHSDWTWLVIPLETTMG